MNRIIFIVLLTLLHHSVYSQKKIPYKESFKLSNIRNQEVEFKNNKNRVFILITNISCHQCVENVAKKLEEIKLQFRDDCEYILVMEGEPSNVASNRSKINHFSKVIRNVDHFLFDFNLKSETLLKLDNYKLGDFPVLIITSENSKEIWEMLYSNFDVSKIKKIWSKANDEI